MASAGVDGVVILWQLLDSSTPLRHNGSYAQEGRYFMPERTRYLSMSEQNISDVSSVSSVSSTMSTTFNSDYDLDADREPDSPPGNVNSIDAAHSLLQQMSRQQEQSMKRLKVLVETLSNVKGSVKGSKGVIDQILSIVQSLESDYQLLTNEVAGVKDQYEELSTGIQTFQVKCLRQKRNAKRWKISRLNWKED